VNSPKTTTDDRLPAPRRSKSRTPDTQIYIVIYVYKYIYCRLRELSCKFTKEILFIRAAEEMREGDVERINLVGARAHTHTRRDTYTRAQLNTKKDLNTKKRKR